MRSHAVMLHCSTTTSAGQGVDLNVSMRVCNPQERTGSTATWSVLAAIYRLMEQVLKVEAV